MIFRLHRGIEIGRRAWRDEHAAQLVEFAVTLPLLVVFVVGIFDFSGAFTLKQKLTNITRDAARLAAADPASDLGTASSPTSVLDAFWTVDNYLVANQINDCGLSGTTPTGPSGLTWTINVTSNGCPGTGLTLTINRGYYVPSGLGTPTATMNCAPPQAVAPTQTAVIATCVSIQYAYQWRFGRVSSLLGSAAILPPTIGAASVAMNEN